MVGKFYLFSSAIQGGYIWLALIGVATSLVSAYYYLRVVVNMYMREGDPAVERESWVDFTWAVTAIATVVFGLVPQLLFSWASGALIKLF